ncbi:hypothetical protein ACKFKF_05830 [Phormidesmis sp. 146-12]
MDQPDQSVSEIELSRDPGFEAAVQKLHELTVLTKWLLALGLWATIGLLSLWDLRDVFAILRQYFTWAALRLGLGYHLLASVGLALCIGVTLSTLIWQSRNILFGLPLLERQRLEKQVLKIHQQGKSHPLWKWVYPRQ